MRKIINNVLDEFKNSLKIIYGMPSYELFKETEAGKVKLGSFCIIEDALEYFCKDSSMNGTVSVILVGPAERYKHPAN